MKSTFLHFNLNVSDLEKGLALHSEALGLTEKRRKTAADGSFVLVCSIDNSADFELELTWIRNRKESHSLGNNEIHLAVHIPDRQEACELHRSMGCICYEDHEMDLYFINGPDGY